MPIANFQPFLIILLAAVLLYWAGREKKPKPIAGPAEYCVYTKEFDVECSGDELVFPASEAHDKNWHQAIAEYETRIAAWKTNLPAISGQIAQTEDTVGCILIDHSGSMRGEFAQKACFATEIIAESWSNAGIPFEILGFTTTSWKGGKSREKWHNNFRPATPGRLCDLLHIVYRSAEDTYFGVPESLRKMFRERLLKENVDGEALAWAASRLESRPEKHKIIVVISDGAPVDDSTLASNKLNFLEEHLQKIIKDITHKQTIKLCAIGIDHWVDRYYGQHSNRCVKVTEMENSAVDIQNLAIQSLVPSKAMTDTFFSDK